MQQQKFFTKICKTSISVKFLFLLSLFTLIISSNRHLHGQNIKYVHKIVSDLTAPNMFGRSINNKGDSIAADYVAKEFNKLKLLPYNNTATGTARYYQPLTINNVSLDNVSLEIGKGKILRPDDDYYIMGFSPSVDIELNDIKPILIADQQHWNLMKGTNLNDIVLVFNVNRFNMSARDMFSFVDTGLGNIKPKLIIFQGYEKVSYYIGRDAISKFPVLLLVGEPIGQNISYLKLHIKSHLKTNHTINNVIGTIEGRQKDKYLLITSHHDALGMFGNIHFPGAQDNAIGVAAMLDLATHYAKPENRPPYSIMFIAFAGEEIGTLGSKHFVNNPAIPLNNIHLVLNLDLVGSGSVGLQMMNGTAKNTEKIFAAFNKINKDEFYFHKLQATDHRCISDHCPFVEANVPALFLMTMGLEHQWSHSIYDSYANLPFTKYESLFRLLRDFVAGHKF